MARLIRERRWREAHEKREALLQSIQVSGEPCSVFSRPLLCYVAQQHRKLTGCVFQQLQAQGGSEAHALVLLPIW